MLRYYGFNFRVFSVVFRPVSSFVARGSEGGCCCEKVRQTPRITVARLTVILVSNCCEGNTAILGCCSCPSTKLSSPRRSPFLVTALPSLSQTVWHSACVELVFRGYEAQFQHLQHCCSSLGRAFCTNADYSLFSFALF